MTLASLVGYGLVSKHTRALVEKSRQGRCGQATVDSKLARNRQALTTRPELPTKVAANTASRIEQQSTRFSSLWI